MRITTTISETRAYLKNAWRNGKSVGLVPTMGAFHEGHITLMRRARNDEDIVAVSLFVNPIQFGQGEDFGAYKRDLDSDARMAQEAGVDLVFAPPVEEMYPPPGQALTRVHVGQITQGLCGQFREGHFDGVTTVCAKLFSIFQPDRAYFGEKDYQQLQVLRRMVQDLNFPLVVVPVPTVREADGLAMSSRNAYLTAGERAVAPGLYAALQAGAQAAKAGASGPQAEEIVQAELSKTPAFRVQYVSAVHPETLEPATWSGPPMVLAAAAFLGKARLIDNVKVEA